MNEAKPTGSVGPVLSRRDLAPLGAAALASRVGAAEGQSALRDLPEAIRRVLPKLEPYLFAQSQFRDVSRGNPVPHSLSEARRQEVGLTRETWRLEVLSDPEQPTTVGQQLTAADGTAFTFKDLMQLAEKRAVRFPKVMTCLNIGCPLGMGIWEGVPLRDVLWLARPRENLRRVMYYGYHNDDPKQMFRSTLPASRVFEDLYDLPPVIVCYKLNGEWLDPRRGGPVRIVVPEAYGFKCVKWLSHVLLTNLSHANDTYAAGNNDLDSPLKSFAGTFPLPEEALANRPIPVLGWAQAGIGGVKKVQTWVQPAGAGWPGDDPYYTRAPWHDAYLLPPPVHRLGLAQGDPALPVEGLDPKTGRPHVWPMRLTKLHWAAVLPGLAPGEYDLRCRTIDEKRNAQPQPRPFRKSGFCDLLAIRFTVA